MAVDIKNMFAREKRTGIGKIKPNRELKYQISVDWKEEEEEEH